MDAEEFVDAVREHVMRFSVKETITNLIDPPGRKPVSEFVELSQWYLGLDVHQREMVRRVLLEASHGAVFGLFAVLDGVRRIDTEQPPGNLELWYEGRRGKTKLNGDLHDLLNSERLR